MGGGCFHYLMVCISNGKWESINPGDGSHQELVRRNALLPSTHPPSFLSHFVPFLSSVKPQ